MSGVEGVKLAGSVARMGAVRAGERLRPAGPVSEPAAVPASVDDLTTQWLTAALCRSVPGAAVTDFSPGARTDGTSTRQAITVVYNAAGSEAGLPTAVYSKSTPRLVSRILLGLTGAAAAEALFYGTIRPGLDIGAPAGYHGAWDPRNCRSMILIEDVVRSREASFGDATTPVDRAGAESMIQEMASYHGRLWEDPRLDSEWTGILDAEAWQRNFDRSARMSSGAILGLRLAGEEVPGQLHARRREIKPAFLRSLALNVRAPRTLLHQDVHPGNWFRLPDGSRHLYDWQGIAKGNWALDLSYALSAGLDTDDRRAWEQDLLALYLEELAVAGGKPPPFDEAWLAYRQQMFHGLIFWTYTFLVGKVSELQPDAVVRTLIRRTAQAIVDLDSLDAVS